MNINCINDFIEYRKLCPSCGSPLSLRTSVVYSHTYASDFPNILGATSTITYKTRSVGYSSLMPLYISANKFSKKENQLKILYENERKKISLATDDNKIVKGDAPYDSEYSGIYIKMQCTSCSLYNYSTGMLHIDFNNGVFTKPDIYQENLIFSDVSSGVSYNIIQSFSINETKINISHVNEDAAVFKSDWLAIPLVTLDLSDASKLLTKIKSILLLS